VTTKDDQDTLLRSVVLQNAGSILAARQRAERRSEFYLAEAQRLARMGSWALNPSGFFEYWSAELFQIYGIDPANGAPSLDEHLARSHPQDREPMAAAMERMLQDRSGCDVTRRILRPDGELRHVRWVGVPVFDRGAFNGFVGTAMDVTEQERLTQELLRREAYLAEAQRLSHTGSFGWKVSSGEILWSAETFRIFQYDPSTRPTVDLVLRRVHPQDTAFVTQVVERASQDGRDFDFEHRLLMPDGCVKHVHVVAHALGDDPGGIEFAGAVMDVTAARETEERIRQSERELRTIVDTIPAFVVSSLPDGCIDFVSQSWVEYTGCPREKHLKGGWVSVTHPQDHQRVMNTWRVALAAGEPFELELRSRQANGNYRWFLSRAVPLRDEAGEIVKWYATLTDIDDRKRAETLLAGEKRLFEMIARGDSRALILDCLCRLFEEVATDSLSSILLLDANANTLRHGAAPSLPAGYTQAIDGAVIGPSVGSCGTAAYRAEPVIVSDIATDPLWADFRDLALAHGLRACWSSPILSAEGGVLGTFATYYREPRSPTPQEHNVIEQVTHLASIALERDQAEEELQERANLLDLIHDTVFVRDMNDVITYWNRGAEERYGWTRQEALGKVAHRLLQTIFPQPLEEINAELLRVDRWEGELIHSRRDGTPVVLASRWALRRDEARKPVAILETNNDITERNRWRSLTEALPQLVWAATPDGTTDYFSTQWTEYTGVPEAGLLGWRWMEVLHPDDLENTRKVWADSVAGRRLYDVEYRVRRHDGAYGWFKTRGTPIRDSEGRIIKWFGTCTDITDRRRAEEALHHSEQALRRARDELEVKVTERTAELQRSEAYLAEAQKLSRTGSFGWRVASGEIFWSEETSRIFEFDRAAKPTIESILQATHPADLAMVERTIARAARDGEDFAREYRLLMADGRAKHVDVVAHASRDAAGSVEFVGAVMDITERKQGEAERQARRTAELANQAKSEFLARMSHELRTPLTGILGYAEILRGDRTLTERQLHGVGVIRQSGEHLLTLINDILDFARIEAGKLEVSATEIPLARFLRVIADIIGVRAEEKQLAFSCDVAPDLPAGVLADERRLRQVLLNLLANAVKFTDRGEVSLRVGFSPARRLRFEVRDTGIGISEGRWETIFQPFEQAGDMLQRVGGSGLGLAISRQLVRLMGSDIEMESRLGEGSAFWFELDLPVVQARTAEVMAEPVITGYEGPRRKVLVVDDVAANRMVLGDLLGPLGFEMTEAASGREGLEKAESLRPDLILMDSVMPQTDGPEATRRLRLLHGLGKVPIIAISANASGSNEAMALAAGADAFLSKPIDLSRLLAQIGDLLQLQWTCEPRESGPPARQDAAGRVVAPPAHELAVLHHLALLGNMRDIAREAAHLSELDGRYGAFANELKLLAKGYQSKAIVRLVERHMNGGHAS
jgi:PAS domain S-box-containing protein